ncbi:MAG: 2-oxoacid:acceptor oxidoreductase subunit alpha [Legionella sp.]|nr:2-oxoacid:acceptor oxidoreductase subunit alpha [Legionella sp.]
MNSKNTFEEKEAIIIRLVGDSGDGVQLVGEQLTLSAALEGRNVMTQPDFPAEIRAPAGTVAGVSGFQLAISEAALFTAGETLDVLVALNPAALKHSLAYLSLGGLLIINEEQFQAKDWEKAGLSPDYLTQVAEQYQILSFPLMTQTRQAIEGQEGITAAQIKKSKNFYVLGIVLWLFDLSTTACVAFIRRKFKKDEAIAKANEACLIAGFNYAVTLELTRQTFSTQNLKRQEGDYRLINGIDAIALALATLTVKLETTLFVSGYPITPASALLQACAGLESFNIHLLQAEDEIAAICACLGAAYGGSLALTCTSGPGLDLKSEALGLGVMTELPLVLVDVQRAGPSTGLPTKTSQSDLRQALYGRHGEAPLPVLAARSPSDCYSVTLEAFAIAVKYMTPVIVLLDASLANATEVWQIPDPQYIKLAPLAFNRFPAPYQRDEYLARSWNIPGSAGFIHQLGGLEKDGEWGRVSYDADNHQKMVRLRADKISGIAREYEPLSIEGDLNAKLLLIGWGGTYGSLKAAVEACNADGIAVAFIQLKYLNPLPKDLGMLLKRFNKVLVAELNEGQLCQLLRATYLVDARSLNQTNGLPFTISGLVKRIREQSKMIDSSPVMHGETSPAGAIIQESARNNGFGLGRES